MRQIFPCIKYGIILLCLVLPKAFADDIAEKGKIDPTHALVLISSEGLPYATAENHNGVHRTDWGRFDSPCPPKADDTSDCSRPGIEPSASYLTHYYVDTRGGGILSFKYRYQSYGKVKTDPAMISIIDPDFSLHIIETNLTSPHETRGTYWDSGVREVVFDLDPWKYQNNGLVYLQISLSTDGHGDQSKLSIWDLEVIGCDVIPLTPITDEDAISFENGATINTEKLNQATKNGLACMQEAVVNLGSTFMLSSAYRPVSYQAHLRDVWDRTKELQKSTQPVAYCAPLQVEVSTEMSKHTLVAQPATPSPTAPHSMGNAFDATIKGLPTLHTVDTIAANCAMYRRMPTMDPVHYEPKPGFLELIWRQFHG